MTGWRVSVGSRIGSMGVGSVIQHRNSNAIAILLGRKVILNSIVSIDSNVAEIDFSPL